MHKLSGLLFLFLVLIAGCGSDTDSNLPLSPPTGTPGPIGCGTSGTVSVCVAASATTLPADSTSTSTVTATVTDNGAPVPDGGTVSFGLNNPSLGSLSSGTATTTGGAASVTFTAGSSAGTVIVTATYGTANGTVTITLGQTGGGAGGIQFVSATPNAIGIQGGGQPTTSTVVFRVTDAAGAPLPNVAVEFTMLGPHGGEYIGSVDGTPTTASGTTDASGEVFVILNSGYVAGPVTITASVTVPAGTFTASSSVISIGGGIPSAAHFDVAAERLNLPGLVKTGFTTTVSAFIADRFSNYNVLEGTSVSFYTEAGAIDRSGLVDDTGITTVTFRTQAPLPVDTAPLLAPNQEDGWVTLIATVRGEESFTDANGNGIYDSGEPFTDLGEPFIDANDNGIWDSGELYLDDNSNNQYDTPNGVWDGPGCTAAGCRASPLIWRAIRLMFTGNILCTVDTDPPGGSLDIADGGLQNFVFTVSDYNGNMPVPGTTIKVAKTGAGTLIGQASYTVPDGVGGPYYGYFAVRDATPGDSNPAENYTVNVSVTAGNNEVATCTDAIVAGTVD